LLVLAVLVLAVLPTEAAAHDDPIVTVRVMCDGFNVLDMDAVLGEISASATLNVDESVQGDQIQAWVKEQMDKDLRIEIVDMGIPQRLPDGYRLTWTARFSRQDWRQAGLVVREVSNTVVIHDGRITDWTASLEAGISAPAAAAPATVAKSVIDDGGLVAGIPELFGIPVTLLLAAGAVAVGVAVLTVRRLLV
jgi:hypothetical protein